MASSSAAEASPSSAVRLLLLFVLLLTCWAATGHSLVDEQAMDRHRQQGLTQPREEATAGGKQKQQAVTVTDSSTLLTCHQCHSFQDGHKCIHLAANSTNFWTPCQHRNQTSCMVKRFSYTENATSPSSIWSLERNCSAKCEPGCLILGERTKLYVCTSCCKHPYCNIGNHAAGPLITSTSALLPALVLLWINKFS